MSIQYVRKWMREYCDAHRNIFDERRVRRPEDVSIQLCKQAKAKNYETCNIWLSLFANEPNLLFGTA